VSVVITTYNTGRYLPETLESVFAQSHPAAEVIVVDDGSSDDSVARAEEFGDRIHSIARPHAGLGPARNAGIAASTGDYLAFLDSDDLWVPEALETQLAVAARNPASGLIVADGVLFGAPDVSERPLYGQGTSELFRDRDADEVTGRFHRQFAADNRISCPAQTLLPRWVHDALGPVCTTPNGAQDYDYYLRIARSFPITFHRAVLARWRFRADSMSGGLDERRLRWTCQTLGVVAREREATTPETRSYVDAAFHARVRRAVLLALETLADGRYPDRDDLAILYGAAPKDPSVLATRAALALPPAMGRRVAHGALTSWRAAKRVLRSPAPR
jgi:glycosyltransferase involved in cell wall biosynthesis